jgi:hypothetical protein
MSVLFAKPEERRYADRAGATAIGWVTSTIVSTSAVST